MVSCLSNTSPKTTIKSGFLFSSNFTNACPIARVSFTFFTLKCGSPIHSTFISSATIMTKFINLKQIDNINLFFLSMLRER